MLHGFEGRGRFKVFALGRVADWNVAYRADGQDTETYTISIIESNIRDGEVRISDKQASKNGPHSGVEVTISELHRDFRS